MEAAYSVPGADDAIKAAENEIENDKAEKTEGKEKENEKRPRPEKKKRRKDRAPSATVEAPEVEAPKLIQFDPEKNLVMMSGETRIIFGTNLHDFDVFVKVESKGCEAQIVRNADVVPPQDTCNIKVVFEKIQKTENARVIINMSKINGKDPCTQIIHIVEKRTGSGQMRKKPMKTTMVRKAKVQKNLEARANSGVFIVTTKKGTHYEYRAFEEFNEDEKLPDDI